jgi:hypothetical protein
MVKRLRQLPLTSMCWRLAGRLKLVHVACIVGNLKRLAVRRSSCGATLAVAHSRAGMHEAFTGSPPRVPAKMHRGFNGHVARWGKH